MRFNGEVAEVMGGRGCKGGEGGGMAFAREGAIASRSTNM